MSEEELCGKMNAIFVLARVILKIELKAAADESHGIREENMRVVGGGGWC